MGLFDAFKKKGMEIGSPLKGKCVSIKEVSDPTFSEEILGKGVAVIPEDGKVCAPADGGVSLEEEKDGKLICEQITPFENVTRKLWIKFATKEEYEGRKEELFDALRQSEGKDSVVIYVAQPKMMNALPRNWNVHAGEELVERLTKLYGAENVKVV